MQRLPQHVCTMRARFFSSALWHALRFCGVTLIRQSPLTEPRIIFGTPTTGWMPKEKQVGMPLVSYAPWQETLHRTPKNELDARSSQLGDPAPLSVTSSPILGRVRAAEAAPTSKKGLPDCCPDLAESGEGRRGPAGAPARSGSATTRDGRPPAPRAAPGAAGAQQAPLARVRGRRAAPIRDAGRGARVANSS